MMEFGKSLIAAREAKGYTIGQIAEQTHLAPTTIKELETEDFSRIAAPIYGRGFVKLYCEAVGVDAKPFVAEFMEIYNGNREIGIKERAVAAPPVQATPETQVEPKPSTPKIEAVDLFDTPQPDGDAPEQMQTADTTALATEPEIAEPIPPTPLRSDFSAYGNEQKDEDAPARPSLTKYSSPLKYRMKVPSIPPSFWRISVLLLIGAALLVAIAFGLRALYRATSQPRDKTMTQTVTPKAPSPKPERQVKKPAQDAKAPAPKKTQAVKRTPQKIPALYVD